MSLINRKLLTTSIAALAFFGVGFTSLASASTATPVAARHAVRSQAAPIQGVDSLWVWQSHPAAELADQAAALGVSRVFLFVGTPSADGDTLIKQSVQALHDDGIEVYALGGEPGWVLHHKVATTWARRALTLAPFEGLHIDVEPQALPGWQHHNRPALVARYLQMLKQVSRLPGVLEADVAFSFGQVRTHGHATLADRILGLVDGVTVMSYRDSAFGDNSMTDIATDWLQRAEKADVPVWLAAETNPVPDFPSTTFYEEGQAQMADVLAQVDTWAADGFGTYEGLAIEDLDGWLALAP